MKTILSESTKVASYLLWEKTMHNNALDLWYCCEDIAYFLEKKDITTMLVLESILKRSKYDYVYISFVQNIAYRIYTSTGSPDCLANWFIAENLLYDSEWSKAIITMAYVFRVMREKKVDTAVRTDWIRKDLNGNK